MKAAALRCTRV